MIAAQSSEELAFDVKIGEKGGGSNSGMLPGKKST